MKSWVEGPFLKVQNVLGNLLNPASDRVPVHLALGREDLQDQEVEGAFEAIIGVRAHLPSHSQLYKKAEHCVKRGVIEGQNARYQVADGLSAILENLETVLSGSMTNRRVAHRKFPRAELDPTSIEQIP
jgi:hypothetical protein